MYTQPYFVLLQETLNFFLCSLGGGGLGPPGPPSGYAPATPVYCALPLKGFTLEFGIGAWGQKNESGGATRPSKKYDDIFSRLDTIRQCDGRTDTGRQQRPSLRIASSGKKAESFRFLLRVRLLIGMLCAWLTRLPLQVT